MPEFMDKIERLLEDIVNGRDEMIEVGRVGHVLRVLRAQREMQDRGLLDD